MDLSLVVADPVSAATSTLGFSKFAPTSRRFSAAIFGSIARPPVKPTAVKRSKIKKKRRVKKTNRSDGGDDSSGDSADGDSSGENGAIWVFGDSGGGGFYGGGGGFGWGGGDGDGDDDEFFWASGSSVSGVWLREVFIPILMAACLHFSIQRVLEIMEDAGRDKVQPL